MSDQATQASALEDLRVVEIDLGPTAGQNRVDGVRQVYRDQPAVSVTGEELRCPIEPSSGELLHPAQIFEMPTTVKERQ